MVRERQRREASLYLKEGVEEEIAAGTRKRNNSAVKYVALQIVRSERSELLHQRPQPGCNCASPCTIQELQCNLNVARLSRRALSLAGR